MIDWIIENKEWLFSGVGVAIIAYAIALILKRITSNAREGGGGSKKISQNQSKSSGGSQIQVANSKNVIIFEGDQKPQNAQVGKEKYRSKPLPEEIVKDIKERPIYQQKEAAKCYEGLKVKWRISLLSIYERYDKSIIVSGMQPNVTKAVFVRFKVNIECYPELKVLREGQDFYVSGKISSVDGTNINLSDINLEFD